MKRILTLVASALIVSGCAGIPSSAPIKYGTEINSNTSDQFIQVIGRPPVAGMDQAQIINGFLTALADSRADYLVAKQYLLPETASIWRPNAGITIYESAALDFTFAADVATARISRFGVVDSSGYLEISPNGTQQTVNFTLAKNDQGEWRIKQLADGILLTANDVDRSFNGYPVYFLSPDRKNLVADTVLFPQSVTGSATALIRALLDGQSNSLALATVSAFPTGTKLSYDSVPVDQGIATVDLTEQVLSADQTTRAQMCAQIVWTLSSLPNVSSVEIKVSGQPFAPSGISEIQRTSDWESFNPKQFDGEELVHFVRGGQVFALGLDATETVVTQTNPKSKVEIGQAKGAIDGGSIAAVSSDGKQVLLSTGRGGELKVIATGDSVTKPSWDQLGSVFFADYGVGIFEHNSKGQIRAVGFDTTNYGFVTQVKRIAIAKDGVRIAIVISNGSTDYLLGGAIAKSPESTRIVGLHLLERNITSVKDLAWHSPTSLAVLGSDQSGGNLIFDIDLSTGANTSVSAPLNAQSIASSLAKQIYVGTTSGSKSTIAKQTGTSWSDLVSGSSPYLSK
jgi:hypothetical protein